MPPAQLEQLIPDAIGLGLMQHALTEFTFLARILPPLYAAENRDTEPVVLPGEPMSTAVASSTQRAHLVARRWRRAPAWAGVVGILVLLER